MNRLEKLFAESSGGLLNVYFTAGFPDLNSTAEVLKALDKAGADLVEVGIPFSDPLADGPTIQDSNQHALDNGMTLELLLTQVAEVRSEVEVPIILMGYFNQIIQFGEERFLKRCRAAGVDGLILPDLPLEVYEEEYAELFQSYGLGITFLITPQTSEERIRKIDRLSHGFIYMVSSASITGSSTGLDAQEAYFQRIADMDLETPRLIGFGVSQPEDYQLTCRYSRGAIVGSAFIRALRNGSSIDAFVRTLKAPTTSTQQP